MNEIMLTLGEFGFGISTAAYQELSRATDYRWPGQDRFMQEQALQFVGPGGDTITLPGVIYPLYRGGFGQLDELRAMAAAGESLALIDGAGVVLGKWVILRIEERQSTFAAAGKPLKIEFTIDLRRAGDIQPEAADADGLQLPDDDLASNAEADAMARAEGFPDGYMKPASLADKFSAQVSGVAAGLNDAMAQVSSVAGQIGSTVSSVVAPISKAIDTAKGLQASIVGAKNMIKTTTTALGSAKSLTQLVNAGASAAANATQAGKNLSAQVKNLQTLGTVPAQAITAVQNAGVQINRLTSAASKLQRDAMDMIETL